MTLPAGTRLGSYEVASPLGSGGMGEVYCARDMRLGRDVAIKVLPAERLADAGRRARFEREARTVAALSHPHIVTIHEIESDGDVDFIVMELVQGETVAQRLRRGRLPTAEVLRLGISLADALAAAHAAGVVHRDLKPANVMLGRDGVVKVLDFGLAKLRQDDTAGSEAQTETAGEPLSHPGTVAGTAGYMAPEQASGGDVDARSDVFSFGVLLYEMVTGRRAFPGVSSTEALAAVLRDQPKAPSALAPDVPRELERIIMRCLRKEPGRRFQHMADVKVELQEVKEESDSQATAPAAVAGRRARRQRNAWLGIGAALLVSLLVAAAWWETRKVPPTPQRLVQLTSARTARNGSFSPDGNQIAFDSPGEQGANWDIWLSIVGEAESRRLTTDPAPDCCPAWSPDGKQIVFVRTDSRTDTRSIYLVSPLGGSERRLGDFPTAGPLSWSPDGRWLAVGRVRAKGETTPESGGVHLIPIGGGEPSAVTSPKPPAQDAFPAFSPDGRTLAFATCKSGTLAPCDVYVLGIDPGLRPHGAARRLPWLPLWVDGLAWTRDGRSVLVGSGFYDASLWRVRADGGSPPERVELAGRSGFAPFFARSQDRLGFSRRLWDPDIYRLQLGGSPSPLIASPSRERYAQYSPDGRRIAFQSGRSGDGEEVWLADADGSDVTRLTRGPGVWQGSPCWSPDGRTIVFDSRSDEGQFDIWTIGIDGAGLRQVTREPSNENLPSFSRDGRWIYFASDRTGPNEVWRVPTGGGAQEQMTYEGGWAPFDSFDGQSLYYARSESGQGPLLARPTSGGMERTIVRCVNERSYAVGPGGIFYLDCAREPTSSQRALRHWDAATGQNRAIGTLEAPVTAHLCVSPDGRSILFDRSNASMFDLMMIENFR